ncbi:hypothetical protein ACQ4PT_063979 [Festuca glaucescens]
MGAADYLRFLCALGYNSSMIDTFMGGLPEDSHRDDGRRYTCPATPPKVEDLNYPSVAVPHVFPSSEPRTVTRRVRNMGTVPVAYDVRVDEPRGVSVAVRRSRLEFAAAGEEKEFAVTFKAKEGSFLPGEYVFGGWCGRTAPGGTASGACSSPGSPIIIGQFTDKQFRPVHDLTIGVEFAHRMVTIDNKEIKIYIWDTVGFSHYQLGTSSHSIFFGENCRLITSDELYAGRRETFNHLASWLEEVSQLADWNNNITIGNKTDLAHKRVVSTKEGEEFARENGLAFIETSANTGHNVDRAFVDTSALVYEKIQDGAIDLSKVSVVLVTFLRLEWTQFHHARKFFS